jgi:hypothetical protein
MTHIDLVSNLNIADQCIMSGHISLEFFAACTFSVMLTCEGKADVNCYLAFYGC